MKALLTHGYFLSEDAAEQKIMMPYPPQGLMHLQAYLTQRGFPSEIFDSTFSSFDDLTAFLLEHHPARLGIYCNLLTRINIMKIIRFTRNEESLKNTVIILGGPDVRHHAGNYLQGGADLCVMGEGEETLYELLNALESGVSDFSSVSGIVYKGINGDVISNPERPFIKNLDDIPFPDFNTVPVQTYFDTWKRKHGFTSVTVSTMRGCPYSCKWCSKAVYGNSYRRRSPEKVVLELARLRDKYTPDRYWFVDDVFTISKTWLQEFQLLLREHKVKISYECITRADKMDEEIIELLKDSGCYRVWIGAESGSQKVLDLMDRRVNAGYVREMIRMSKKDGIETGTFLMLGYPGETIADIDESLNHLMQANPDLFTLTIAYPIKGTAFYEDISKTLKVPSSLNWGEYSDRDLDFKRTYSRGFYRHAIRYLHHSMSAFNHGKRINPFSIHHLKNLAIARISRIIMTFYSQTT